MPHVAYCRVCGTYIPQPHNVNRSYCSSKCYMKANREKYARKKKEHPKRLWPHEWVLRWAMALADDHGAKRWRNLLKAR